MSKISGVNVFIVISAFVLLAIGFQPAVASEKFSAKAYIKQVKQGELFVGGTPPKLFDVQVIKEIPVKHLVKYKYKVIYKRASRDSGDRTFPILKAKSWLHLAHLGPGFIRAARMVLPQSPLNGPFPTLKALINYKIRYGPKNVFVPWFKKPGKRRRHANPEYREKIVVEYLNAKLSPGPHALILSAEVELADHPLKKAKTFLDWVELAANPISLITEYVDGREVIKKIVKERVKVKTLKTESEYSFEVLAKNPKLVGMREGDAKKALKSRKLKWKSSYQKTFDKKKHKKVFSQNPAPGARLKKDHVVEFKYYLVDKINVKMGKIQPGKKKKTSAGGN